MHYTFFSLCYSYWLHVTTNVKHRHSSILEQMIPLRSAFQRIIESQIVLPIILKLTNYSFDSV